MKRTADHWIAALGLAPHPEGGFFREIYRAGESIPRAALPPRFPGARPFSTSIYFLLKSGQVSRLHRLKADEIWNFYDGVPALMHIFGPEASYVSARLGRRPEAGEHLQFVVPAGAWFGVEVEAPGAFSLFGCTVAPGFVFEDFEFGGREELASAHPSRREIVERLTAPRRV